MEIKKGLYKHSKSGKEYKILGLAKHSETMENLIVYQGQYISEKFGPNPIWCRPVEMFLEEIEIDGQKKPRFEYLG